MRAETIYKNTNNYLHGFEDVWDHKSLGETGKGILKIFSYIFIPAPIIAGLLNWYYRNIVEVESQLQNLTQVKTHLVGQQQLDQHKLIEQSKLVDYLVYKVERLFYVEKLEERKEEIALFQKGFKLLTFDSQYEFFKKIASNEKAFKNTLLFLPDDIEELNFTCSKKSASYSTFFHIFPSSKKAERHTEEFVQKLSEFKNLKKFHLDLTGLGCFDSNSNDSLNDMSQNNKVVGQIRKTITAGYFDNALGYDIYENREKHVLLVNKIVFNLREVVQMESKPFYQVSFVNIVVSRSSDSTEDRALFEEQFEEPGYFNHQQAKRVKLIKKNFAENLKNFLEKPFARG